MYILVHVLNLKLGANIDSMSHTDYYCVLISRLFTVLKSQF